MGTPEKAVLLQNFEELQRGMTKFYTLDTHRFTYLQNWQNCSVFSHGNLAVVMLSKTVSAI